MRLSFIIINEYLFAMMIILGYICCHSLHINHFFFFSFYRSHCSYWAHFYICLAVARSLVNPIFGISSSSSSERITYASFNFNRKSTSIEQERERESLAQYCIRLRLWRKLSKDNLHKRTYILLNFNIFQRYYG